MKYIKFFVFSVMFVVSVGLAGLFSLPSMAQDTSTDEQLQACNRIQDQADRLACFRRVLNAMDRQLREEVPIIRDGSRDDQNTADEDSFGRPERTENRPGNTPDRPDEAFDEDSFGLPQTAEEQEQNRRQISAIIENAYRRGDGKWVFELANGHVWQTIDSQSSFYVDLRRERTATIRESSFGGYRLEISDMTGFLRVTRSK